MDLRDAEEVVVAISGYAGLGDERRGCFLGNAEQRDKARRRFVERMSACIYNAILSGEELARCARQSWWRCYQSAAGESGCLSRNDFFLSGAQAHG